MSILNSLKLGPGVQLVNGTQTFNSSQTPIALPSTTISSIDGSTSVAKTNKPNNTNNTPYTKVILISVLVIGLYMFSKK